MTIDEQAKPFIDYLNSLLEHDPYAVAELIATRVVCNETLADHPTVQVSARSEGSLGCATYHAPGQFRVGILGILNGFFGSYPDAPLQGWGPISAVYDDGKLVKFALTREQFAERGNKVELQGGLGSP